MFRLIELFYLFKSNSINNVPRGTLILSCRIIMVYKNNVVNILQKLKNCMICLIGLQYCCLFC